VRTLVRKARESVGSGAAEKADQVKAALVALDRAAAKGALHKNNVARRKSRLMKLLNKSTAKSA
jgi:small subunit ribosomal protein S20